MELFSVVRILSRAAVLKLLLVVPCLFAQTSDAVLRRYSQDGEKALAEHRYSDAEQAYERLRQLAPSTAEVYARLGVIYFQERKFERAVPVLQQALKLKPTLPNADILLAMSLSELGRYSESVRDLEKGFRKSTDDTIRRMAGLQLERAYTGLHQDSKAVEVALELTRLYPDDPEILYHGGRLFGNFAWLTMQKLAQVAPSSVWRHQAAGEAYESQENYDAAISEYQQVLAQDPRRPGIHYRLGRVLLARSQQPNAAADLLEQALQEFERELETDPSNANAAYEAAEIHHKSAQFDQARELFEAAIRYYPDFEEARVGLAAVLILTDHNDLALQHLRRAIALNPLDEVAWFRLYQAERALGDGAEAQTALLEFRRLRERETQPETPGGTPLREVTKQKLDGKATADSAR